MRFANHVHTWARIAAGMALLLLLAGPVEEAQAQWVPKWLNVGDFQSQYHSGGFSNEGVNIWWYPAIRPGVIYNRWKAYWVSARNVTDETGRQWPVRTSYGGPRVVSVGQVFDVEHILSSRYEQPSVIVDGAETFLEPVVVDAVDSGQAADRMITSTVNSSIGITMHRRAMQWSHPDHEDYHLVEYTFTNTGNVDGDDEIEIENNTLEDVYFTFLDRPNGAASPSGSWDNSAGGNNWGQFTMNDAVGDGLSDYGVDFRAQFAWSGNIKETNGLEWNTLGTPMWRNHQWNALADDTLGRLGSAAFSGIVTIHADAEAHEPGAESPDDPAQPRTMTYLNSDFGAITSTTDHTDEVNMALGRAFIECGSTPLPNGGVATVDGGDCSVPRTWPTHARLVMGQDENSPRDSQPDFANQTSDPSRGGGAGGWGFMNAYGPYDLQPGREVKIVVAEGVTGLSEEAQWQIGRAYKLSGWDDAMIHEFDANGNGVIDPDEALTKNEWVMTARDSLFQMFQRAIDNYRGGLNAPHPPPPPTSFEVTSGTDKIDLTWSGPSPSGGWEVWRAQKHYSGVMTVLQVGPDGLGVPDEARQYELVASLPGNASSYEDTDVVRGGSYFYFLQAVGSDGSKSNRYYAQTYNPAFLRRPPGTALSDIRIVPNPYHLGADPAVRLDVQDRMAFYGLPGQARIDIYSELGELIRTIEHTDGSGDEFWDMTTSSRQLVVSGIYIAVITNNDTGEQTIQKLIVIR